MLALYITALAALLAPTRDVSAFAETVARFAMEERPLFVGDEDRHKTVALLTAVAFRESSFQLSAVGDQGRSVCWMQILNGGKALLADGDACIRRGIVMLRESMTACAHLPSSERLSLYARGTCASADGRRLSRDRMAVSQWAARTLASKEAK
jgi:hypothetical protein